MRFIFYNLTNPAKTLQEGFIQSPIQNNKHFANLQFHSVFYQ